MYQENSNINFEIPEESINLTESIAPKHAHLMNLHPILDKHLENGSFNIGNSEQVNSQAINPYPKNIELNDSDYEN